jgi:23S rRNA pseudouridine1911/1915/1917 synthase
MKTINFSKEDIGLRLDAFLVEYFDDLSRSYLKKLINESHILINQQKVKAGYILKEDDVITYEIPEDVVLDVYPMNMSLDIVYEDDDIAVVNKPKGLVVHPSSTFQGPTLVHGLMYQLNYLSSINGTIRPGIVHRIDKDTTGLLVIAKNNEAHEFLSNQLKYHLIDRKYYALVHGVFKKQSVTIDLPIARDPNKRKQMAVVQGGRKSVTHVQVHSFFNHASLLDISLETGRTHQIRVHLSYIGYPIIGDPTYGIKKEAFGQLLHAYELTLVHPRTKEEMTFSAPLPDEFDQYIKSLTAS